MKAAFCLIFFTIFVVSDAKVFARCELAILLKKDGLSGYRMANWLCMISYGSRFNTNAINVHGQNLSYGIFQINNNGWCNDGKIPGAQAACGVSCSRMVDDDITDDIICAKKVVQNPDGMGAWVAWKNYCKDREVSSYVRGCAL